MDLQTGIRISTSALAAQSVRMRVIAENLANADSTATSPDKEPYRRKLVSFKSQFDRAHNLQLLKVNNLTTDKKEFEKRFDPGHPAADKAGYVLYPNVNPLIELADMRAAQQSYKANLNAIETSRALMHETINLLQR